MAELFCCLQASKKKSRHKVQVKVKEKEKGRNKKSRNTSSALFPAAAPEAPEAPAQDQRERIKMNGRKLKIEVILDQHYHNSTSEMFNSSEIQPLMKETARLSDQSICDWKESVIDISQDETPCCTAMTTMSRASKTPSRTAFQRITPSKATTTTTTSSSLLEQLDVECEHLLHQSSYFSHLSAKQRRRIDYHRRHHTHFMVRGIRALPFVDLCAPISAEALTKQSFKWDFNIFVLDRLTANRSLFYMAWHLFNYYELIDTFHLDVVKLCRTFYLIEELYHSCNPYHNALHAADVAQAMHCFLRDPKLASSLSKLDIMACILAAFCHDLDHPGKTATYLTATEHVFTKLYANQGSMLERHHWLTTRSLLHETGLFEHSYMDEYRTNLFETIEDMILATDMTHHAQFVQQLHDCKKRNSDTSVPTLQFDVSKSEHEKRLALHLTLKCADICNPARAWPQCRAWAELIVAEFFAQGDAERIAGRTCSAAMNRKTDQLAKIQIGFIKYIIQPLFNLWCSWLNSNLSREILFHVTSNYRRWQSSANVDPSVTLAVHNDLDWTGTNKENETKICHQAMANTADNGSTSSASTRRRHSLPLNTLQSTLSISSIKSTSKSKMSRRGSCQLSSLTNSMSVQQQPISRGTLRHGTIGSVSAHAHNIVNLLEVYVINDDMLSNSKFNAKRNTNSHNHAFHCSKTQSSSTQMFLTPPQFAQLHQRRGSAPSPRLLGVSVLTPHSTQQQQQQQRSNSLRQRSGSINVCADFASNPTTSLPSHVKNMQQWLS